MERTEDLGKKGTASPNWLLRLGVAAILIAVYLGLCLMEKARYERHLNRALSEYDTFMTMEASGPAGFVSAMKKFGPVQNMEVPIKPSLWLPLQSLLATYRPNRAPLQQWASHFMRTCTPQTCGTPAAKGDSESWRINLRGVDLRGVDLSGVDLNEANLSGADLSGSNLSGVDLSKANLGGAGLSGANLFEAILRGATLWSAEVDLANLGGADLGGADLSGANLNGANPVLPTGALDFAC